jgi:hypothetical protein
VKLKINDTTLLDLFVGKKEIVLPKKALPSLSSPETKIPSISLSP